MTAHSVPGTLAHRFHHWQVGSARIGATSVQVASKPGVPAHGGIDPAAMMLAEAIFAADVERSVHLHCGNGLVPAAAARAPNVKVVWCSDRSLPSAEATRRTLEANGVAPVDCIRAGHHVTEGEARVRAVVAHAHGIPASVPTREVDGAPFAPGTADAVTIRIPTDRLAVQQLVWDAFYALRVGGRCWLAGANDEGAKPAVRFLETLFGGARLDAQHSGHRMAVAVKQAESPASLSGFDSPYLHHHVFREIATVAAGISWRLFTRPGVFSWEHGDEATQLLAAELEIRDGESVLDLGCGAGLLGLVAATASKGGRVLLLDADAEAVRCATQTMTQMMTYPMTRGDLTPERRAWEVRASDVATAAGEERFDVVVTNPPFHVGKDTELSLPLQFIVEAHERLREGGRLYLVANRTLPYERFLAERFGNVRLLHDGRRFKVLGATR